MTDSKSFKQARKDGDISGADDLFKIPFNRIVVEQGFNERHDRPELRDHVAGMVEFVRNGGKLPPLVLNQDFEIRDGHCRHAAYQILVDAGEMPADQIIQFLPFRGDDLDAIAVILSSNNGLKLTPLETARGYARMRAKIIANAEAGGYPVPGPTEISRIIAAKSGKSRPHVDQGLILAGAGDEVHAAINGGKISATEAVKVARDHGDDAAKEIDRREKVAQAAGKKKVTAKSAVKPAAKVSNSLIQAVRGFVKEIPEAIKERILLGQVQWVEVDASLLAEVIGAAAELIEDDGSAGGLDGQQSLEI